MEENMQMSDEESRSEMKYFRVEEAITTYYMYTVAAESADEAKEKIMSLTEEGEVGISDADSRFTDWDNVSFSVLGEVE
jgi:hypothetical protein